MNIVEKVFIALIHCIAFILDILTWIPYFFILEPRTALEISNREKSVNCTNAPSGPYRCIEETEFTTTPDEECSTIDELLQKSVALHHWAPCIGRRQFIEQLTGVKDHRTITKYTLGEYEWLTYSDVMDIITHLGKGLVVTGLKPRKNVLLFAETQADWMLVAQACFKYNFTIVTLYATLGDEALACAANEAEVTHIITSAALFNKFRGLVPQMNHVTHIIYMRGIYEGEDTESHESFAFRDRKLNVLSLLELIDMGKDDDDATREEESPLPTDVAVIMYTSGSAGTPKGVILTHSNIMSACSAVIARTNIRFGDTYIAFLPQAHILELVAEICCMYVGARIGYSSPYTLFDESPGLSGNCLGDLKSLKPTLMASVPAILDRISKSIWERIKSGSWLKRVLFKFSISYKRKWMHNGANTPLVNAFVMSSIRYQLGGEIRIVLCGGAPLNPHTQEFLRLCLCCPILQGYGLTETSCAGTIVECDDLNPGHVGGPVSCAHIKLVDWESYKCTDVPPRGELLIGGPSVALGYYKDPNKTSEDFLQEDFIRWFSTGDIAKLRPDGTFVIIDRKKDLVKVQTGEFVSLGKVEATLKLLAVIENICVVAKPEQKYIVALVCPSPTHLQMLADSMEITGEWKDLCHNKSLTEAVLENIIKHAKQNNLLPFETPQKIKLISDSWHPDGGLVTSTYKPRREQITCHYYDQINSLFPSQKWNILNSS